MSNEYKPAQPKRDPDEIFAKIMAEPEVHRAAEMLGIPVEEYAQKILFYTLNPDVEPTLEVMDDEEAKEHGIMTVEEVGQFLEQIANGEIDLRTEDEKDRFAETRALEKAALETTGIDATLRAPKVGEEGTGKIEVANTAKDPDVLKQQLGQALNQMHMTYPAHKASRPADAAPTTTPAAPARGAPANAAKPATPVVQKRRGP